MPYRQTGMVLLRSSSAVNKCGKLEIDYSNTNLKCYIVSSHETIIWYHKSFLLFTGNYSIIPALSSKTSSSNIHSVSLNKKAIQAHQTIPSEISSNCSRLLSYQVSNYW